MKPFIWIFKQGDDYLACCKDHHESGKTPEEAESKLETYLNISRDEWHLSRMFSPIDLDIILCKQANGNYIGTNIAGYKYLTIGTRNHVIITLKRAFPGQKFFNVLNEDETWAKEEVMLLASLIEEHTKERLWERMSI